MKIIETIAEMKRLRREITQPIGFVPTMGYLHEGHLALVKRARAENPSVAASIFVNPAQFGPQEDLDKYPRDPQRDLALLEKERTDIVFMPSAAEMYPSEFSSWVEVNKVTKRLEGALRPGHFKGVTTVVAKLFNIVEPARAYFGQKDAQQAVVIKKMVADLNMNLEIITVPTVREPDGLAMSSRNIYLNPEERQAARVLYQSLALAQELYALAMSSRNIYLNPEERQAARVLYQSLALAQELYAKGERNAGELRRKMTALIQKQPLASIDYVSIAHADTLDELEKVNPPALVSLAVKIGKTRLIDNILL